MKAGNKDDSDNNNRNVKSHYDHDLLQTLMGSQDLEGDITQMSDTQLRDEVMTIFLAGHETTSNALTWTCYLLSQYPDIERRLYRGTLHCTWQAAVRTRVIM